MNENPCRNVHKLSFWLAVKEEWLGCPSRFLCHASKTFKKTYSLKSNRAELERLKEKFLQKSKMTTRVFYPMPPYDDSKGIPLFFVRDSNSFRRVRTNFIDWNIRRLSKQKQ